MPTLSSLLLLFQGLPILLFGASTLLDPAKAGFADVPASVVHVLSFGFLSLGTSYVVTAFQSRRARHHFLLGTIPLRIAAAIVFHRDGADARGAPAWDYVNAGVSTLVVGWETVRG